VFSYSNRSKFGVGRSFVASYAPKLWRSRFETTSDPKRLQRDSAVDIAMRSEAGQRRLELTERVAIALALGDGDACF
jgi:hypothetical protein